MVICAGAENRDVRLRPFKKGLLFPPLSLHFLSPSSLLAPFTPVRHDALTLSPYISWGLPLSLPLHHSYCHPVRLSCRHRTSPPAPPPHPPPTPTSTTTYGTNSTRQNPVRQYQRSATRPEASAFCYPHTSDRLPRTAHQTHTRLPLPSTRRAPTSRLAPICSRHHHHNQHVSTTGLDPSRSDGPSHPQTPDSSPPPHPMPTPIPTHQQLPRAPLCARHPPSTELLPARVFHNTKQARSTALYVTSRRVLRTNTYAHALHATGRLISSLPTLRATLLRHSHLVHLRPSIGSVSSSFSSSATDHRPPPSLHRRSPSPTISAMLRRRTAGNALRHPRAPAPRIHKPC